VLKRYLGEAFGGIVGCDWGGENLQILGQN
jgi:hypothetical protein